MSTIRTTIKFDGDALVGKSMDVSDLAPSLIALSDLIKASNYQFNDDRVGVKVLINANLQQNCFELHIDLAQTMWDSVSNLISDDKVATIKEISEWIGIISGTGISLYKLIKFLSGKKIESTKFVQKDGKHSVQINIVGDNNSVSVPSAVWGLYQNQNVRKKAIDVLNPLTKDGYDSLEFYDNSHKDIIYEHFSKSDVSAIQEHGLPEVNPENLVKSNIRTVVKIRKAAYEGKSKWTLVYRRAIECSIEDEDWLKKYQSCEVSAPPGSSLDVELEEKYITNDGGEQIEDANYKVIKVHGVILQLELDLNRADKK